MTMQAGAFSEQSLPGLDDMPVQAASLFGACDAVPAGPLPDGPDGEPTAGAAAIFPTLDGTGPLVVGHRGGCRWEIGPR